MISKRVTSIDNSILGLCRNIMSIITDNAASIVMHMLNGKF